MENQLWGGESRGYTADYSRIPGFLDSHTRTQQHHHVSAAAAS